MSAVYLEAKRNIFRIVECILFSPENNIGVNAERQRDVMVKACLDVRKTQQVETLYSLEEL